jgi:phosphocarrier protein HPr
MAARDVVVSNRTGIHARPSLAIANTVRRFNSEVEIRNGNQAVNAKDILQLLSLGAAQGTRLTLTATGPDADQVLDALELLFRDHFGMDGHD